MKVLLINVDSKMPNLALMKISSWHKARGDEVGFEVSDPDFVYASVIFKKNAWKANGLKFYYPSASIICGGVGYDPTRKLLPEIETMQPDYSLYPEMDYSFGYVTRGCDRDCYFCVVPFAEGGFRFNQWPWEFYNDGFKKIYLLDNNILIDWEVFRRVLTWCRGLGLGIRFVQGLDIRLMREEEMELFSEAKRIGVADFAWDFVRQEKVIAHKIKMLENYFDLRHDIQFFVYVDSDKDFESGLYRCNKLKELGTNPFLMYNMDVKKTERIRKLIHWANRKHLFWSCSFEEYYK